LNSDAYSKFISDSYPWEKDNDEVKAATDFLYEQKLPSLVEALLIDEEFDPYQYPEKLEVAEMLHKQGVNIRCLGRILQLLVSEKYSNLAEEKFYLRWIQVIKSEIVSRAMKSRIRLKMRELHSVKVHDYEDLDSSDENSAVLKIINSILWFKEDEALANSSYLEHIQLKQRRKDQQEEIPLLQEVIKNKFDLDEGFVVSNLDVDTLPRPEIFLRLCKSLNMKFTVDTLESRKGDDGFADPIDETELLGIDASMEELNLISYADGVYLFMKAQNNVGERSIRLLRMAIQRLDKASNLIADTVTARELYNARFVLAISLMKEFHECKELFELCSQFQKVSNRSILGIRSDPISIARELSNVQVKMINVPTGRIYDLKIVGDGKYVVLTSTNSKLFLYLTELGTLLSTYSICSDNHKEWIRSLCEISEGHYMVGSKVSRIALAEKKTPGRFVSLRRIAKKKQAEAEGSVSEDSFMKQDSSRNVKEDSARYTIRSVDLKFMRQFKKDGYSLELNSIIPDISQDNLEIHHITLRGNPSLIATGLGHRLLIIENFNDRKGHNKKTQVIEVGSDFRIICITVEEVFVESAKSTYVFCGCSDSVIRIVNLETMRVLDNQIGSPLNEDGEKGHLDEVHSLCLVKNSSHTNLLASAGSDATIRIWNLRTLQCEHVLRGHADGVLCLRMIPKWHLLVSTSSDGTVRLWSTDWWWCVRILSGCHKKHIYCIDSFVSGDKLILASGGSEGRLCLWTFERKLNFDDHKEMEDVHKCRNH
jgi:WD40 repeat protein